MADFETLRAQAQAELARRQSAPQSPAAVAQAELQRRASLAGAKPQSVFSNEGLAIPQIGQKPTPERTGSLARDLSADSFSMAGAALRGAFGYGPSVVTPMLEEKIPNYRIRQAVGRTLDVGLSGLSAIGGAYNALAGVTGDIAQFGGMSRGNAERMSRDIAAMPEAFAGTIGGAGAPYAAEAAAGRRAQSAREMAIQRTIDQADRLSAPATALRVPENMAMALGQASRSDRRLERAGPTIAAAANVDADAMAAADRLRMNLPTDVFSRSQQLREQIGMNRSQVASPASTAWRESLIDSLNRADGAIAELNASTDLSSVSDRTRRSLQATRDDLESRGAAIYKQVEAQVPSSSRVEPANIVSTLNSTLEDLGGSTQLLSAQERELYRYVTSDAVTYAGLARIKRDIGRAIGRGDGPYKDADRALLDRLYGAVAEDQLAAVRSIAGEEAARQIQIANGLWAQNRALGDKIVDAFGKDLEGSVARDIRGAVTSAAGGDVANLNRILDVVPAELRRDAVIAGIVNATRGRSTGMVTGGADAGQPFGFAEFVKFWGGARSNSVALDRIKREIGPEASRVMDDLYTVGRYVQDARANVLTTGKANQQILNNLAAEGLLTKVMDTSVGRAGARATGAGLGALIGNVPGALAGAALTDVSAARRVDPRVRLGNMITSPRFQNLLAEAATSGKFNPNSIRAVSVDPAFRAWAHSMQIADPQAWLNQSIAALAIGQTFTGPAGRPVTDPASVSAGN